MSWFLENQLLLMLTRTLTTALRYQRGIVSLAKGSVFFSTWGSTFARLDLTSAECS